MGGAGAKRSRNDQARLGCRWDHHTNKLGSRKYVRSDIDKFLMDFRNIKSGCWKRWVKLVGNAQKDGGKKHLRMSMMVGIVWKSLQGE